jgi:hypothetical protein
MIKLKQLLLEYNKQDILNKMYQYWKECLQKYFDRDEVGGKYPRPNFEIKKDNNRSAWFKYTWLRGPAYEMYRSHDMTIGINPDFATDDESIKANIYHETIHYYEFLLLPYEQHKKNTHEHHGDFFKKMMDKINSGEGKQLVTIKQEVTTDTKSNKVFWVYGYRLKFDYGYEYSFSWTQRKNDNIINFLAKTSDRYDNIYLFQTDKYVFKKMHQQIGTRLQFSKFKDPENEIVKQMIQYAEKNNTYKRRKDTVH